MRADLRKYQILLLIFCSIVIFLLNFNSKGTTTDSVNVLITRDSLKNVKLGLELYKAEFGEYPRTLDEFVLRKEITDRSVIEDAWGNDYHYVRLNGEYILFSNGRDNKPYTTDDIHPEK